MTIENNAHNHAPWLVVVVIGGGAGNVLEHMQRNELQGVRFVHIDAAREALENSGAQDTLLLGDTGLGSGGNPEIARKAAEATRSAIHESLLGVTTAFIVTCLGGGTGSGAAPVVASIARKMGIRTLVVATKPFSWEGKARMQRADAAVAELQKNANALLLLSNEKLADEEAEVSTVFTAINDAILNTVNGILTLIGSSPELGVDWQDLVTSLDSPGDIAIGTGSAVGANRARIAAEQALAGLLFKNVDLSSAKSILISIYARKDGLQLSESRTVMDVLCEKSAEDASTIFDISFDENLGDTLRVTVLATGLSANK